MHGKFQIGVNIHFFVNGRGNKKELKIKYFPTHLMLTYFSRIPCKAVLHIYLDM